MLTRKDALSLVRSSVENNKIVCHMLAVEAIMRGLARNLNEDEELWGLTGLLHDIDYEKTKDKPEKHAVIAEELLEGHVSEDVTRAIKTHNFQYTKVNPETKMEKALVACDALSGLLIACALVMPSKKLEEVKVKTVVKKFKDKDFARGADRDRIALCEEIGVKRESFFQIALEALKDISYELGL
jgi:hypothetical protein